MTDPVEHISGQDARAGAKPRMTRYILAASLALIIIIYAAILLS